MPVTKQEWPLLTNTVADDVDPFVIDAKSWLDINVYVNNGVMLPEEVPQTDLVVYLSRT